MPYEHVEELEVGKTPGRSGRYDRNYLDCPLKYILNTLLVVGPLSLNLRPVSGDQQRNNAMDTSCVCTELSGNTNGWNHLVVASATTSSNTQNTTPSFRQAEDRFA